jgi:hypothetical protein
MPSFFFPFRKHCSSNRVKKLKVKLVNMEITLITSLLIQLDISLVLNMY